MIASTSSSLAISLAPWVGHGFVQYSVRRGKNPPMILSIALYAVGKSLDLVVSFVDCVRCKRNGLWS